MRRVAQVLAAEVDELAPRRRRRLDREPEDGEGTLGDMRGAGVVAAAYAGLAEA